MPVELDIAGNFGKGQETTLARRRAKQLERARDYELAREEEGLLGRRDLMRQQEETYGLEPLDFAEMQTNGDPLFQKILGWWKQRRAKRVLPQPMMPEQQQTIADEMGQLGLPPSEDPAFGTPGFANGGKVRRAIPQYAEGGSVASEEEMIRRRAAANRSRNPARVTARTETAIPRRPGMTSRLATGARGVANKVGPRGAALAGVAATLPQLDENYDRTLEKRFGFDEPTAEEGDASFGGFAKFFGRRMLGYASDLGNMLTLGTASSMYRDAPQTSSGDVPQTSSAPPGKYAPTPWNERRQRGIAAQPEAPTGIPKTPDEAIAQQAISEGKDMAQQAAAQAAPPGHIDFSKVDFEAGDIPNMPVTEWVDYRARMVRGLMAQGMKPTEAHAQVTQLQQQGFVDYAQQALMHLQGGNANAAATALRAAYQYFPNGTDVQLGVQAGKDGQPVIVGVGRDEVTGEPKGNPMVLNSERLAMMIENFSNPDAFRTWTKDWRDEQFNRQKYEEVEKPEAESNAQYRDRAGRAALINAGANVIDAQRQAAASGGRRQVDLDRANSAFQDAVELLGYESEEEADQLMALMAQIYARAEWQYPEVIDFVRKAKRQGRLPELMQRFGLGTPEIGTAVEAEE